VWTKFLAGQNFVNVLLQDDRVLASCSGEVLWHNPRKGFGLGLATIATEPNIGIVLWPRWPNSISATRRRQHRRPRLEGVVSHPSGGMVSRGSTGRTPHPASGRI
jgi:hypothetical protein